MLQIVRNADVVHHEAARFVLEDPIDPRNRLHQIVVFHGLINVHCCQAGYVKAGEPHIPYDHDSQWVVCFLESLL